MEAPEINEVLAYLCTAGAVRLAWKIILMRYSIIRINHAKLIPYRKLQRVVLEQAMIRREHDSKL